MPALLNCQGTRNHTTSWGAFGDMAGWIWLVPESGGSRGVVLVHSCNARCRLPPTGPAVHSMVIKHSTATVRNSLR